MKRDMDLIRQILLKVEELPESGSNQALAIEGKGADEVCYHARLAFEAGFIEAEFCDNAPACIPYRLTWTGHEFLDTARKEHFWGQWKAALAEASLPLSFEVLKAALPEIIKRALGAS